MSIGKKAKEIIINKGFDLLYEDKFEQWDHICNLITGLPIQYKSHFIDYNRIYNLESGLEYYDISLIIRRGGQAIGVWPLCISKIDNMLRLGSLGAEILPPIFANFYSNTEKRRALIEECIILLEDISRALELQSYTAIDIIMNDGQSLWGKKLMEKGANCTKVRYQLFYDLLLPIESANIRRTNKYSIRKGRDLFDVNIINKDCIDLNEKFEDFHQLHVETAGRETSGFDSWNSLKDGIANGDDFLIMLYDKGDRRLVGAALFIMTKAVGSYAVAAYDRSLFDKPVGHVVQAAAIEHMQKMGLRWYDIGERVYQSDNSDKKIINISHYKEGFATNTFLKTVMHIDLNQLEKI